MRQVDRAYPGELPDDKGEFPVGQFLLVAFGAERKAEPRATATNEAGREADSARFPAGDADFFFRPRPARSPTCEQKGRPTPANSWIVAGQSHPAGSSSLGRTRGAAGGVSVTPAVPPANGTPGLGQPDRRRRSPACGRWRLSRGKTTAPGSADGGALPRRGAVPALPS